MKLKAPFPYFGGKSSVAGEVWRRFGSPKTYVEPFCGSAAILLARPGGGFGREIVNDYDGHIANVWRALQADPDTVAKWCDWPCNHIDLMARKIVINREYASLREALIADADFYDAKMAGYYIWCASNWIGPGLTSPNQIPNLDHNTGVKQTRECQIPQLSWNNGVMPGGVLDWLRKLQRRLHGVKVVCGDWTRVLGGDWRTNNGDCAVFLDPPYSSAVGRAEVYGHEDISVAHDVRKWCMENGGNNRYRIALCGYDGEHNELETAGWSVFRWKAGGGYANTGKDTRGQKNRLLERIWFSPHCLLEDDLFAFVERKELE
jgi:DNA adenine methylase